LIVHEIAEHFALNPNTPLQLPSWTAAILVEEIQRASRNAKVGILAGIEVGELQAIRKSILQVMALLHDALGSRGKAFQELERAGEENSATLFLLEVDPKVDALRQDPRYADFRNRFLSNQGDATCLESDPAPRELPPPRRLVM
jgi:hypothetical protein